MPIKSSIPLDVFTALPHLNRLELFDQIMGAPGIERFIDLDVLRAIVLWNDANGDYDHFTRADFIELIEAWREEG